jgi:hypothetical protein
VRIEREREGDFCRWSVEWDDWLLRVLLVALIVVLVPRAGAAILHVQTMVSR